MQNTYKIAIFDMNAGHPNEGMRCIKMLAGYFLAKSEIEGNYDIFEVRVKGELPALQDYDIYISSGGPGSPLISGEAWETDYFDLLDEMLNHNLITTYQEIYVLNMSFVSIGMLTLGSWPGLPKGDLLLLGSCPFIRP